MSAIRSWAFFTYMLIPGAILAAGNAGSPENPNIRLAITKDTGAELQLEVRQAPLPQVLDNIAKKTGVRINYSVLPDGLVTATCVGPTVKQIMACLLIHKADFVFRYSRQSNRIKQQDQPIEAWVLGVKFGAEQPNSIVCSSATLPETAKTTTEPEPDQTDELVKMANSKIPAERVEAIGRLMKGGREGDVIVKKTLEAALSDQDATVRVRAVSSLVHREGTAASRPVLHEALYDKDVSVRLTAVDNAGDDVALLQQALTDSDATVRQLAGIRLEPLLKAGGAQ